MGAGNGPDNPADIKRTESTPSIRISSALCGHFLETFLDETVGANWR
jgi:hypothetical protein